MAAALATNWMPWTEPCKAERALPEECYKLGRSSRTTRRRWVSTGAPPAVQLLDFLHDASTGALSNRSRGRLRSAKALLKAINWMAVRAQTKALLERLGKSTIKSFWRSGRVRDRKEALPIPARAVSDWENRLTRGRSPTAEVRFFEALLLLIWAGLRFGDLQRCCFSNLNSDRGILRGNSWRTKASDAGQPGGPMPLACQDEPPVGDGHTCGSQFSQPG